MLIPQRFHTTCPNCSHRIRLSSAAGFRSKQLGVYCHCAFCSNEWLFRGEAEACDESELFNTSSNPIVQTLRDEKESDSFRSGKVNGFTVSIIDNDPRMRRFLQRLLQNDEVNLWTFASSEEFLQSGVWSRPGCLVLDVNLPGMDGVELQQELNLREIPLPVIFLTDHKDNSTKLQCLRNGAFGFFEKPCQPAAFRLRVQQALELSQSLHESRERRPVQMRAGLETQSRSDSFLNTNFIRSEHSSTSLIPNSTENCAT